MFEREGGAVSCRSRRESRGIRERERHASGRERESMLWGWGREKWVGVMGSRSRGETERMREDFTNGWGDERREGRGGVTCRVVNIGRERVGCVREYSERYNCGGYG